MGLRHVFGVKGYKEKKKEQVVLSIIFSPWIILPPKNKFSLKSQSWSG